MTRFPTELAYFLDRDNGERGAPDDGSAARPDPSASTADEESPQKLARRSARWALSPTVDLATKPATRQLLDASQWLKKAEPGDHLLKDLARAHRKGNKLLVPIQYEVEAMGTAAELARRSIALQGVGPSGEGHVNGITILQRFRSDNGNMMVDRFNDATKAPRGFHILIVTPEFFQSKAGTVSTEGAVMQQEWFSVLQLATTLFHELLHARWIATRTRTTDFMIDSAGYEVIDLDRGGKHGTALTGHSGKATWKLDPVKLTLTNEGPATSADAHFTKRLTAFVKAVVAGNKLDERVRALKKSNPKNGGR